MQVRPCLITATRCYRHVQPLTGLVEGEGGYVFLFSQLWFHSPTLSGHMPRTMASAEKGMKGHPCGIAIWLCVAIHSPKCSCPFTALHPT